MENNLPYKRRGVKSGKPMKENNTDLQDGKHYLQSDIMCNLTVVHYGGKKYQPHLIKPIENHGWVKPDGGLWTSPINSNWGWKDWCLSENFRDCNEANSFKLKFKPDAKIMIIDSLKDLLDLPKCNIDYGVNFKKEYPDFELLATMYDAIWLTEKGQHETHLSFPISLYGWDCETVLIINGECCYEA